MEVGWRVLGHPMGADTHCPPQMLQRAVLDAAADTGAAVQESISSIEMVRVFNGEEEEEHRYSQVLDRTLRLRDQRDTERAIFLLIRRVRLAQGDTPVSRWDGDIPAEPHPTGAAVGRAGTGAVLWAPAAPRGDPHCRQPRRLHPLPD